MHKLACLLCLGTILLNFSSCDDQDEIKHLNSFPRWNNSLVNTSEVFLFFGKDLGKSLFAKELLKPSQTQKLMPSVLKIGGLPTIGSYLKIAKEQFGDQSILISAGASVAKKNSFEKNRIILASLAQLPIDVSLLSHHELIAAKEDQYASKSINWLNSNIIDIKKASPTELWESVSYKVLQRGSIRIGIVGVADLANIEEEQKKDLKGNYFQDASTAILKLKKKLSQEKSQFNILIFNGENSCDEEVSHQMASFQETAAGLPCLRGSKLEKLLERLPPNLIHFVIATKGKFDRGLIAKTPVLGNPDGSLYLSGAKLSFSSSQEGHLSLKDSIFLAPLKMCQKMFAGLEDCQFTHPIQEHQETRLENLEKTAYGLIQARFLGREVRKNDLIEAIINGTVEIPNSNK